MKIMIEIENGKTKLTVKIPAEKVRELVNEHLTSLGFEPADFKEDFRQEGDFEETTYHYDGYSATMDKVPASVLQMLTPADVVAVIGENQTAQEAASLIATKNLHVKGAVEHKGPHQGGVKRS